MIKFILLFLSFSFVVESKAQSPTTVSQQDIDMINFAITDQRYRIFLVTEMSPYNLDKIKKYVERGLFILRLVDENGKDIPDSIQLTQQDKDSIFFQLNTLKDFKWTLSDAKRINFNNVAMICLDSSTSDRFDYAIKYHIVPPIYFQNHSYCILSFVYHCGPFCGHGQITIYKKTADGWKRWNNLMWWDE